MENFILFPLKNQTFIEYSPEIKKVDSRPLNIPFEIQDIDYPPKFRKMKNEVLLGTIVFNDAHIQDDTIFIISGGGSFDEKDIRNDSKELYLIKTNK